MVDISDCDYCETDVAFPALVCLRWLLMAQALLPKNYETSCETFAGYIEAKADKPCFALYTACARRLGGIHNPLPSPALQAVPASAQAAE